MKLEHELVPTLEVGGTKVSATLQEPLVTLTTSDVDAPTLSVEEGAVALDLEFPSIDYVRRFQERIAALHIPEGPTTQGAPDGV
jgi:hypothetical protein